MEQWRKQTEGLKKNMKALVDQFLFVLVRKMLNVKTVINKPWQHVFLHQNSLKKCKRERFKIKQ